MQGRNLYLGLAVVALAITFWLTTQMSGLLIQLLFVAAIALLAVAVGRAWHRAGA